ncbi:hypothetical protein Vadar_033344 [Vaccinium darrowii]|uniref:Uncharacterized protein n=1 Tax=Vaccinium darrowii TaxID=229202 RepID=A0ACB7YIT6_9ERIC|nr:hypothetical protein Vadar_033344 [Vaccinium darrowii]
MAETLSRMSEFPNDDFGSCKEPDSKENEDNGKVVKYCTAMHQNLDDSMAPFRKREKPDSEISSDVRSTKRLKDQAIPDISKPPDLSFSIVGDTLREFVTQLEPFQRSVVRAEVENAVERARVQIYHSSSRTSLNQSESSQARVCQLHFVDKLSPTLFTGSRIESEGRNSITIAILDSVSKKIISSGPFSSLKVQIVVLDGDFGADDWTEEDFNANLVRERGGKRPLVTGDLVITLRDGVGSIRDVSFADNSSWIRSRKFRLGARAVQSTSTAVKIREARSEAFVVKDHRGELYKKHHPPKLNDEIWRLEKIAKGGTYDKALARCKITTVKDFLRSYYVDPSFLRHVLVGISNKTWQTIIGHATACLLDDELYAYNKDGESIGFVFNSVYRVVQVTFDGGQSYLSLDMLNEFQMGMVENLKRHAYKNLDALVPLDVPPVIGPAMLASSLLADPFSSSSSYLQDANFLVMNQEYMDRFGGQTELHDSKPKDFQFAIEEAYLAESGYHERDLGIEQEAPATNHREIQEATDSNEDQECYSHSQASYSSQFYRPSFQLFADATRAFTATAKEFRGANAKVNFLLVEENSRNPDIKKGNCNQSPGTLPTVESSSRDDCAGMPPDLNASKRSSWVSLRLLWKAARAFAAAKELRGANAKVDFPLVEEKNRNLDIKKGNCNQSSSIVTTVESSSRDYIARMQPDLNTNKKSSWANLRLLWKVASAFIAAFHSKKGNRSQSLSTVATVESSSQDDCAGMFPDLNTSEQSASSSCWPIGLLDGGNVVLLDPLEQPTKNAAHVAKEDLCSPIESAPKKMVRKSLKRKCRTMSSVFEDHRQHFGRRCEGTAKSLGATRICMKHGIDRVSSVNHIHKPHGIHWWPFRHKWARRKGYSLGGERTFEVSSVSMDDILDSRLLFFHMPQFARSSLQTSALPDGGKIVGPVALSSSELAATNNRAHYVRQDQNGYMISHYEWKSTRVTSDRQGIAMSLCSIKDLHQHFGCKHKDVVKRLGVNVPMFKRTCRKHQIYCRPRWLKNNERKAFEATNNREHLIEEDQSGPTVSNLEKETMREASNRKCITKSVLISEDLRQNYGGGQRDAGKSLCDSLVRNSLEVLDVLPLWEESNTIEHLVPRRRLALQQRWIRPKKSLDLPRTLQMNCTGGLTVQSASSLHWPIGLPAGGHVVSLSKRIIVRKTFKRECRTISVSFEGHQQHFGSRCEGVANSPCVNRICEQHGISLVPTVKHIHRQHGIHRLPFRQGNSFGRERPVEVISVSTEEKLISRLQFLRMSLLGRSSLRPLALPSGSEFPGHIAFSSSELTSTNNRAYLGRQDQCGSSASRIEKERTREMLYGEGTASHVFSFGHVQQHFGSKRKNDAKILGVSLSTFKRITRHHGIRRWPNQIRNNVWRSPDPYREENLSPTFKMLSTNCPITMENDMGCQNLEPNELLPDSFEDVNFWNGENGLLAEIEKTPTFHGSFSDNCSEEDICLSEYDKTQAARGSFKWAFQLKGLTMQFTANPNLNTLVFPHPQIASTEVLSENMGNSENGTKLLASQAEGFLEGDVSECSNLTFPLEGQSMQATACPNHNTLQLPQPLIALTQILNENMGSSEDWIASQQEPFLEGHVSGSINLTVPTCSGPSPSQQPMPTTPYTMHRVLHLLPPLSSSLDASSVKMKATYRDTIIEFQLPLASGSIELKEEVAKILKLEIDSFDVRYKDEEGEGDWILLPCDKYLRNYLQLFSSLVNPVIRLLVVDKGANLTNLDPMALKQPATFVESGIDPDNIDHCAVMLPNLKNELTVSCLLKYVDCLFSRCGDERIIVFTTNHRDRNDAALLPLVNMDIYIPASSPQPIALPDGGEIVQLESSEQKPLVDFDGTNNRECHSGILVSSSKNNNKREASKRLCMTESVLSVVDPTTGISLTEFDAPNNGAHLVRACQGGSIMSNSEKKDTGGGLKGDFLTKSVLSLDDSTKHKSLPDCDATENEAHLLIAYQSCPVVSLLENRNRGEALKRECITKSILGLEDLQQHSGGRRDNAAKSFAIEPGPTKSPRYSGGSFAKSGTPLHWSDVLPDGGQVVSLSEKEIVRKTLKRKGRTMKVRRLEYQQLHFDRRCQDAAKRHGAKRICRKHVINQVSTVKCIHRQHAIHWWPFRQKWAMMKVYSLEGQRPLEVISPSTGRTLVARLQVIHVSWLGRSSPGSSAIPGGGEILGFITLSSSGFAATNNRANLLGQNPSGSTASHSKKKRQRDAAVGKGKNSDISEQDLRHHFGLTRDEAAKRLGVSVSTLKRQCRKHGITRWCNQIESSDIPGRPPDPNEGFFAELRDFLEIPTNEASGSYEAAIGQQEQITLSVAYRTHNGLVRAQPHIASKEMASDNPRSSNLTSQVEARLEGDGSGSSYLMVPTSSTPGSSQPVSTIPETGPTIPQHISTIPGIGPSQVEACLVGHGSGSSYLMVSTSSNPASSQLMSTIPETGPTVPQPMTAIPGIGPTIPHIMPPSTALQDTRLVKIKAMYKDYIIKFKLPLTSGLNELNEKVAMRLKLMLDSFDLEYKDEDEEWILISCDEDLRDYLDNLDNPVKLLVRLKGLSRQSSQTIGS